MSWSFVEGFEASYASATGDGDVSGDGAMSVSDYQKQILQRTGTSFRDYKRPTMIRQPRGDYDVAAAPTQSSSEYLRSKYGTFAGATVIDMGREKPEPQTRIEGVTVLTVGDLKLLQNSVDLELLRLQNLRSDALAITIRKGQLDALATALADLVGRVERKETRLEDVPIFPATAKQFLRTFRISETLPELLDPNGNTPAKETALSAPPPSKAPAPSPTPPSTTSETSKDSSSDFLQWVYENIQSLKMGMEAEYKIEEAKEKEMKSTLDTMERRILAYSYKDTPMPEGYQALFLEKIRGIQSELNRIPE